MIFNFNSQKFQFLSFESSYFKSMFLGNFAESNKSEVTLHDIDSYEFQKFIEVLYGRNAIDGKLWLFTITKKLKFITDDYLASILRLADMFDASIVRERCQDFLVEKSKKSLKEKLELASEYRMENLKVNQISEIFLLVIFPFSGKVSVRHQNIG